MKIRNKLKIEIKPLCVYQFIFMFVFLLVQISSADVRILDGDTITFNERKIRISGIDAPEKNKTCLNSTSKVFKCGLLAKNKLTELINENISELNCEYSSLDKYGRYLGKCWIGDIFINSWMVRNGLALAYRQYSKEFIKDETIAKENKVGIWNGQFVEPWNWRRGERLAANKIEPPEGCVIKGNISSSGEKIYHLPGGQYYNRTKISQNKGEKWFCSEKEAKSAGWRKSKR